MVKRLKSAQVVVSIIVLILLPEMFVASLLVLAAPTIDIPKQAIRLRIIAASDAEQDQAIKRRVRDVLIAEIGRWAEQPATIEAARGMIQANLSNLERRVQETLADFRCFDDFTIQLGKATFPTKVYAGKVYPAGTYEALVVTIGQGAGHNWWCVLFPPLCFIDETTVPPNVKEAQLEARDSQRKPRFWLWERWLKLKERWK